MIETFVPGVNGKKIKKINYTQYRELGRYTQTYPFDKKFLDLEKILRDTKKEFLQVLGKIS